MHFKGLFVSTVVIFVFAHVHEGTVVTGKNPSESQLVRWVSPGSLDLSYRDPDGTEGNSNLYTARTNYSGGIIPGKHHQILHPDRIYFAFNGKELISEKFEVLVFPRGVLTWTRVSGEDNLPTNTFPAGVVPVTGEVLYVCRVHRDKINIIIGKVSRNRKTCVYPYVGEKSNTSFEILVDNRKEVTPGIEETVMNSAANDDCSVILDSGEDDGMETLKVNSTTTTTTPTSCHDLWYYILGVVVVGTGVTNVTIIVIAYFWFRRYGPSYFNFSLVRRHNWDENDEQKI